MSLSDAERSELACVYAGLMLFDDGVQIDAGKIQKILTASGNNVESFYPEFFAKYMASADLKGFMNNIGGGAAAAPAQAPAAAAAAAPADKKDDKAAKGKKEEPKKKAPEPEPEEEGEGGFGGLFD